MKLSHWLDHIALTHPREIDLGLDRVREVAGRMGLARPAPVVFTVAGTNGKGSTVAAVEAILLASGLRTGAYLSPHIERFNERFRVNGAECDDESICAALAQVERARAEQARVEQTRGATPLTYFEFATLAALSIFSRAGLDCAVLEVGLGGRLDAVNIVDADVALITNIALDHQHWLGDTREAIGAEKAGILRPNAPLVYGEAQAPASITRRAAELNAPLWRKDRDFGAEIDGGSWSWWGRAGDGSTVRLEGLEAPELPLAAMAAALQALHVSPLSPFALVDDDSIRAGIRATQGSIHASQGGIYAAQKAAALPGRLEWRRDRASGLPALLDVAHNPAAAGRLAGKIATLRAAGGAGGKVAAVLAMLADKDIEGFAAALGGVVDVWYIAAIDNSRALSAVEQARRLRRRLPGAEARVAGSVAEAWRAAVASGAEFAVATGSFHTVAAVRPLTRAFKAKSGGVSLQPFFAA